MSTRKTGVTTILKDVLGNSEGLMRWANRVGLQGLTMDEARSRNRKAGTSIHEVLERAARALQPVLGQIDDAAWALAVAEARSAPHPNASDIAGWIEDTHPLFDSVELAVNGPDWQGRADYTRLCEQCGRLVVGDLKPSGPFIDSHLQVAAYRVALEWMGRPTCRGEIVVYKDGWRVHEALAKHEDWLALMECWRALNRVRRRQLTP